MKLYFQFLLLLLPLGSLHAQIVAEFKTSEGNFDVILDYVNAPLATANFIHLAGKKDDIFETRDGVPVLGTLGHNRQGYYTTRESDVQKLPLTVSKIDATEGFRAYYEIKQNNTFIGAVEIFPKAGYYEDITGRDRYRLELVNGNPTRYRITIRYPRPWLDARDQRVKHTPMYRDMPITHVETGGRFFSGGFTSDRGEGPGYRFQDEVLRIPGNTVNPYGTAFNTAWILAMDSLAPNRNGSRFFITAAANRNWNGQYTAFGTVRQGIGRQVVADIANAQTTSDGIPNTEMFIKEITFRRALDGALIFFESLHQDFLPGNIEPLCLEFEKTSDRFMLVAPARPQSQTVFYQGTNLLDFGGGFFDAQPPGITEPLRTDLTSILVASPKRFFKAFATEMPNWPSADLDLKGARLAMKVNSGDDEGSLNLNFDDGGRTGSYTIDMKVERRLPDDKSEFVKSEGNGTFSLDYFSDADPYSGTLKFVNVNGPLNIDELTLHFDSTRFANNPGVNPSTIIKRFSARITDVEKDFLSYSGIYQKLR